MIGRLGGEEFAIASYDAGRDKALAIAERIRLSFENAAMEFDGRDDRRHRQHGHGDLRGRHARHVGDAGAAPTRRSTAPRSAAATASRRPRSRWRPTAPTRR